jgi:hypothetical protein
MVLEPSFLDFKAFIAYFRKMGHVQNKGTYPDLARFMALYPEVMILRKFSYLNAKNLLYYEAELANLEHRLKAIEREDRQCERSPRQEYATSWKKMAASEGHRKNFETTSREDSVSPRNRLQWQTFLEVRETLCKYSEYDTYGRADGRKRRSALIL